MDIRDAVVVVTGSSSGIGLALSEALVEHGAFVWGLSRRKTVIAGGEGRGSFRWVEADLARPDAIEAAFGRIRRESPPIDALVNNAGWGEFGDMEKLSTESWQGMLAVNLSAPFLAVQEVLPEMKKRGRGTIVNVASVAGRQPIRGAVAYCTTKYGLVGFSATLREEVRADGVRVTCVCPGAVDTPFFTSTSIQPEPRMGVHGVVEVIIAAIAAPDDVLYEEVVVSPLKPLVM
ncbi:SDR family oxidoreductase [Chlorobium sp. N1]|uniref:SDR family oxidoreductase n=1 Tax=Chlorobium sp. N1 TaxID=2491138 RepID=UPI00103D35C1|nr:SDR family oxidoreductase [Chlorobium sp. N1]TCD48095.1 SDR family oxidoreductase [Chlorobium sp. N1]